MSYTVIATPNWDASGTGFEGVAVDQGVYGYAISGSFVPWEWAGDVRDGLSPADRGYTKIYDWSQPGANFDDANAASDAAWTPGISSQFNGPDGGTYYRDETAWYR